ncbi:protein BIC1-like [Cynara cardunculus var. scolymus]|uniref:protein BIC1-like n=1 Tax=Cynara cardunculus var. scolymus TaxID=59895 RepID=UPI000D62A62B|nr:protein BIC1-like [Cynara cardunculus var. scolymus]
MDTHKNPNLETTPDHAPPSSSQDRKINHGFNIKNLEDKDDDVVSTASPPGVEEESGRERLKRHRLEMAGRVWIPDIWEQEDLLKDWIDCSMFDSSLGNKSIMSARTALVQEARSTATVQ